MFGATQSATPRPPRSLLGKTALQLGVSKRRLKTQLFSAGALAAVLVAVVMVLSR